MASNFFMKCVLCVCVCVCVCGRLYTADVADSVQWFLLVTEDTHVDFVNLELVLQRYNSDKVSETIEYHSISFITTL